MSFLKNIRSRLFLSPRQRGRVSIEFELQNRFMDLIDVRKKILNSDVGLFNRMELRRIKRSLVFISKKKQLLSMKREEVREEALSFKKKWSSDINIIKNERAANFVLSNICAIVYSMTDPYMWGSMGLAIGGGIFLYGFFGVARTTLKIRRINRILEYYDIVIYSKRDTEYELYVPENVLDVLARGMDNYFKSHDISE